MLYVGKYPQIYPHTILGLGHVSRDGLPRGTLPSGIFKLEKYCPGLKVRHPIFPILWLVYLISYTLKISPSNRYTADFMIFLISIRYIPYFKFYKIK